MIAQSNKILFAALLFLFYLQKLVKGEGMLYPTRPVRNAILDQNSNSLLTLYFRVSTALTANNYLKIQIPDYGMNGNQLNVTNCLIQYSGATTFQTATCGNLTADTMYVLLSSPVVSTATSENILQIELSSLNPINDISQSLRVSTISSITSTAYFQYDENPNFGQIPFTNTNNDVFQASVISYGTPATINIPNLSNTVKIQIQINKSYGLDLNMSRIKLILSAPWVFDPATTVTCIDDSRAALVTGTLQALYKAPTLVLNPSSASAPIPLIKTQVETPNQLSIVFAQGFKEGSAFVIQISSIVNPSITAQGVLKIYSLPVNSNESVEANSSLLSLQTLQIPISVTLLPSLPFNAASPTSTPINFYKNTKQYVKVQININSKTIQAGYPIVLQFTPNTQIIQGSEYLDTNMIDINGNYIRNVQYQSTNTMIISNLKAMTGTAINPTITISVRVLLSKTDSSVYVNAFIYTDLTLTNPVFSGVSNTIALITNYKSVILSLQDQTYATNGFVQIKTAPNDITFTIKVPSNDMTSNLKLQIFVSPLLIVETAIACKIGGTAFTCSYNAVGSYVRIDMTPTGFTTAAQTIVISNIKFSSASNHEDSQFELFFRMTKDSTNVASTYNDFMIPITVIQKATANINAQFINDLNQSTFTTLDYSFPSFLDLYDTANTFSTTTPRPNANQQYYISVYSQQGYSSIVQLPSLGKQFYCGSSLSGVSCYYRPYDTTPASSLIAFKEWAKIVYFLPSATTPAYHMIIPFLFNVNTNYAIQIEGGYFNTATYVYQVLFTNTIYSYSPTTTLASVANLCASTAITLSGNAGAKIQGVPMQLARSASGFPTGVGSTAILVTDWQFWFDSSSQYTTASALTGAGTGILAPVSVSYIDKTGTTRFAVVFPFDQTAAGDPTSTSTTIKIDNVVLPFSYDLPNLLFIITQSSGKLNCYKQYFNSGRNLFYMSTPQSLSMTCDSQADGVQNTQCTISFNPAQQIQRYAILQVSFTGMQAFTNQCTLVQKTISTGALLTMSQSCSVSTDSRTLTVVLQDNTVYSNDAVIYTYLLSFYGVSIDSASIKSFTFQIRDLSGNTVIEQQTINVSTTTYSPIYISVSQLIYKYLNPYVFSQLTVQFATPRQLLPNENVLVSLGSDLSDVNANTDRLTITLFLIDQTIPASPVNVPVPMAVSFQSDSMLIQLTNRSQFVAANYIMIIDGILTPASNSNDLISIRFIRTYDSGLVLQNTQATTVPFPTLLGKINSNITLSRASFQMEGSLQQFIFNVTMENSQIVSSTVMYIYFPIFYAPAITNFASYLYCRMDNIQIPCSYKANPFRLELSESPLFIQPGQEFSLLVYGPVAPQFTLRNSTSYQNETIFFAVDTGATNSFSEYIHITPPIAIQVPTNFPYMRLITVTAANTNTRALATHVFLIETDAYLPSGNGFQVVFPTDYSYLQITSTLEYMVSYYDTNNLLVDTTYLNGNVTGLSVEGVMPVSITASSRFTITIQNVPTPPLAGFVDLSRTIITVFDTTRTTYTAQTNYLTNQMGTIQFVEQTNFVQINGGQVIQVTKGTYSPDILIQTANLNKFVANMVINLSATGFTFLPPSMTIYLGDSQTTFRVGADKNLLEKQYTVSISKAEFGFTPVYQIANNLIIFVISQQIQIVTPSSINVPYGGCSLPYKIVLTSTPYDDVNISIQYDYNLYPESQFIVNSELSSYTLYFDSNTNSRYLSFCSTSTFPTTVTTFTATLTLGGSNIESFTLVNPSLIINMVSRASTAPTLTVKVLNLHRTTTDFSVAILQDGTVYWQIYVTGTATPKSLSTIKEAIKTQQTVIQAPTTLQQQFFGQKADERVGLNVFHTTDTNLFFTIDSLIPETSYTLCTYYQNEMSVTTGNYTCLQFTTSQWQPYTKVNISFKVPIFEDDMNNFLCFFVRTTQTKIKNIINSDGNSCSLQATTQPYYFQFKGKTASQSSTMMNIYLIPDASLENDSSIATFASMYNSATKQLLNTVRTDAINNYGLTQINQSYFSLTFSYDDAIMSKTDFVLPTITNMRFQTSATSHDTMIEIQDVTLSSDGQIYFIAERIAKVFYDNVKGQSYDAPITDMSTPTPQNIINCLNGKGYTTDVCARIVYNNNNKVTLILNNLVPQTRYRIYYVVANHFPVTPIYSTNVTSYEFISDKYKIGNSSSYLSLSITALIALFIALYL